MVCRPTRDREIDRANRSRGSPPRLSTLGVGIHFTQVTSGIKSIKGARNNPKKAGASERKLFRPTNPEFAEHLPPAGIGSWTRRGSRQHASSRRGVDHLITPVSKPKKPANDPHNALKTTLKAEIEEEAWSSLYSDTSRPFEKPKSGRIAVKVINHLGDEVMKVLSVGS
jgi:hypothetical protein